MRPMCLFTAETDFSKVIDCSSTATSCRRAASRDRCLFHYVFVQVAPSFIIRSLRIANAYIRAIKW